MSNGIIFDPSKKIIRRTTAPFEFVNGDGELETREITVEYYSLSTKHVKDATAAALKKLKENPGETQWFSEIYVERIHALPDLLDPKTKKAYKITIDFLDSLDLRNLDAIRKAIEEDVRPKEQPSK